MRLPKYALKLSIHERLPLKIETEFRECLVELRKEFLEEPLFLMTKDAREAINETYKET